MIEPEPRRNTEEEWRVGEQRLAALDGWAEEVGDSRRGNMEPELLAMLTEEEQDAYAFACAAPDSYFGSAARLAWAQSLAEARRELSTWTQEFSRTLDDGRPYVQDALEAGKELQDAQAEARMAGTDLRRCLEALEPFARCQSPSHQDAQFVTREMAVDAGEPTMMGTMIRGELWEPCQSCGGCRAAYVLADLRRDKEEK